VPPAVDGDVDVGGEDIRGGAESVEPDSRHGRRGRGLEGAGWERPPRFRLKGLSSMLTSMDMSNSFRC